MSKQKEISPADVKYHQHEVSFNDVKYHSITKQNARDCTIVDKHWYAEAW